MTLTALPRRALVLQYRVLRLPCQALTAGLEGRVGADARAVVGLRKAIGTADVVAGRLLGDDELARGGATDRERAQELARAAKLEARADERRASAAAEIDRAQEEAA